jgi:hypothetical protein
MLGSGEWGCPFFNGEIPKMSRISRLFDDAQIGVFHFQFPSSFVKLQDSKSRVNIFVLFIIRMTRKLIHHFFATAVSLYTYEYDTYMITLHRY